MVWFTSDFHFGHEKEFLWKPRGFTTWEEYAQKTIENYNSVVQPNDEVYILGDCVLKNDDFGIECLKQLNGKKYLAVGNHDSNARLDRYKFENIFANIQYGYRLEYKKMSIYAQHYPAMMGNYKDKHPTICLAGHTHSPDKFQNMEYGCYNIALDAHNCFPVSIDTIMADIKDYHQKYPRVEYLEKSPYCSFCSIANDCQARLNHEFECPGYVKNEN